MAGGANVAASSPSPEPLKDSLKGLHEKKDNMKRLMLQVASMATELQRAHSRAAEQEMLLANEVVQRQIVEKNSRVMEREVEELRSKCEKKKAQAHSSSVVAEQYLKELQAARANLAVAEARACSASTTCAPRTEYERLRGEADERDAALEETKRSVAALEEEVGTLRRDLERQRELQGELEAEVEDLEAELERCAARARCNKEAEIRKILETLERKDCEKLEARLAEKDEEVSRLREEAESKSSEAKLEAEALRAQANTRSKEEVELRRKLCKLEFWLQESRSHARKLQKAIEQKDKEVKHLRGQVWLLKGSQTSAASSSKHKFWMWKALKLPTFLSISFIVLVCLVHRRHR